MVLTHPLVMKDRNAAFQALILDSLYKDTKQSKDTCKLEFPHI